MRWEVRENARTLRECGEKTCENKLGVEKKKRIGGFIPTAKRGSLKRRGKGGIFIIEQLKESAYDPAAFVETRGLGSYSQLSGMGARNLVGSLEFAKIILC